ncbi:cofilin [Mortierella sp. NVP41]|nr:cofilin [Mortierella sp. NVP41]
MAASGVKVEQICIDTFMDLKIGKKHKYIIYRVTDDKTGVTVVKESSEGDYDTFLGDLPDDDCRWAVYDFAYKTEDGGDRNKIVFFSWAPDNAKIKSKMLYASTKEALRKSLNGVSVEIQGTDLDEVAQETVLEKIRR